MGNGVGTPPGEIGAFMTADALRTAAHLRSADDSVTVGDLPKGLGIYPAYIDGAFKNAAAVKRRFPRALVPTITVDGRDNATIVDQENGDATPVGAAIWCQGQRRAGEIPTEYFSVAQLLVNLTALRRLGLGRNDVVFWTAHYTGKPHICGSGCWARYGWGSLPFQPKIIGTQYDDKGPHGEHYDRSLFAAYWPGVDPKPANKGSRLAQPTRKALLELDSHLSARVKHKDPVAGDADRQLAKSVHGLLGKALAL